jgi:hypothetical protein
MPLRMIRWRRRFWFLLHRSNDVFATVSASVQSLVRLIKRILPGRSSSEPDALVQEPKGPLFPKRSASIALTEPD